MFPVNIVFFNESSEVSLIISNVEGKVSCKFFILFELIEEMKYLLNSLISDKFF